MHALATARPARPEPARREPGSPEPGSPRVTASGVSLGDRPSPGPEGFGVSGDGDSAPDLDGEAPGLGGVRDRIGIWRGLLDRPLTSYYLVLGITILLLGLGLVMVQSAGSVAHLAAGLSAWFD